MSGWLALIGGGEWREGCSFDDELLAHADGHVLVVPTAAAYEHPERAVETARSWFAGRAEVSELPVLRRPDALDPAMAEIVRSARFVYIGGGSPMHLWSVLKDSPVWHALVAAHADGAVIAASSAGAMVVTDPMVDLRGGAFAVGLGLLESVAVIPHVDAWSREKVLRTLNLAPTGVPVIGIEERTAVLRSPEGAWTTAGVGDVAVWLDGSEVDLTVLP